MVSSGYMRVYYKCRLCGEIYSDQTIPKNRSLPVMAQLVLSEKSETQVIRYSVHNCDHGEMGFADFIGMKEEKDE